ADAGLGIHQDDALSDAVLSSTVHDPTDQEGAQDTEPIYAIEHGSPASERARLRRFAAHARDLRGDGDPKLLAIVKLVSSLLHDGFHPIVYCRYIATAIYVAAELNQRITIYGINLRVLSITGERSEEEREVMINELIASPRRVLVATDCLSEGINLQDSFDAVIHYDLPWNPNRLEQREGRIDRYGQRRPIIRTALLLSHDNPIDQAVMKVLLRKAVHIHRTLGITVPLPLDSEAVMETLIGTLFEPPPEQLSFLDEGQQLSLLDADEQLKTVEQQWNLAIEREKESRTRFAQRRMKPDEIERELQESDAVLGDPLTVERFVRAACERLGSPLQPGKQQVFTLALAALPDSVRYRVSPIFVARPGDDAPAVVSISFVHPPPENTHSIGRNHELTGALADYLIETALTPEMLPPGDPIPAARSSLIRTDAVEQRTVLLLMRVRMIIERGAQHKAMLAEELVLCGFRRSGDTVQWLDEAAALELLAQAQPATNISADESTIQISRAIEQTQSLHDDLDRIAHDRAKRLSHAHQRVRQATSGGRVTVRAHVPADLIGVYVLLPVH
ncbi:MAG: SWF/SNF helicase family protein, partial [Chloroflexaceae bacterium]|nr:SWF/SNF helicase family protein [Chloroflexaceae bacterium]